jgi:hypothetical protein
MTGKPKGSSRSNKQPAQAGTAPSGPQKPWRRGADLKLNKTVWDGLYPVYFQINKETRQDVGLMLKVPVFIKDPLVALENPTLGIQEISVRFEKNMGAGPTSARVAVVDFNADTQKLTEPVIWDEKEAWFRTPLSEKDWLPDPPKVPEDIDDITKVKNPDKYKEEYRQFIESTINNPYFHQLNAWAVVQRVLEFYEESPALGRPVPWGFDGNRLMIVPHAGFGENAFYDQHSKSLQFYYFGDQQSPGYTCLSHDIIAHETGHAILDGIRPMYNQLSSVQTAAFHEFIGDLTAILLALFNNDIRHFVSKTAGGLTGATILADLAKQFGQEVEGRDYLRTAFNQLKMRDVANSLVPHTVSQVMTGAMWEILTGIAGKHMEKNRPGQKVTLAQALWWSAERFRRVALQPLDLCPPCDIQFIDYARAVIRNDILTNPMDEQGYRPIMLDVFHRRGLCPCKYKMGKELPKDCLFNEVMQQEKMDFINHKIEQMARSRTAAYYFLSDNRNILHIPRHQDVRVVDLYDASKLGAAAERLPGEVIVEYAWQEEVVLANDPQEKLDFGAWNGRTFNLDCGGTLVFDERGNLLSWFRKPGTEHLSEAEGEDIRQRLKMYQENPEAIKHDDIPTKLELGMLADLEIGRQRKKTLLSYLTGSIKRGLVGKALPESRFSDVLKPITALDEGGVVRFEMTPHLRTSNFDEREDGWLVNY